MIIIPSWLFYVAVFLQQLLKQNTDLAVTAPFELLLQLKICSSFLSKETEEPPVIVPITNWALKKGKSLTYIVLF